MGKKEGAKVLIRGARTELGGDLKGGYDVQRTLFKGTNDIRVFHEEIFGPVLAVANFKDEAEALATKRTRQCWTTISRQKSVGELLTQCNGIFLSQAFAIERLMREPLNA